VARTTTNETKALGFGIFYMIVNIGGWVGPTVSTVVRGWGWDWVFLMSAIWIGLNFIPLMLVYKEPASGIAVETMRIGQRVARLWQDMKLVLGNTRLFLFIFAMLIALMIAGGGWMTWSNFGIVMGLWVAINVVADLALRGRRRTGTALDVKTEPFWSPMRLGDWRFALYLLILSGFWTEFNQIFLTMPLYIRDYTDTTSIQTGVASFAQSIPLLGDRLHAFWQWILGFITEGGQIKPENLVNLDALAIVFFQVAISAFFARFKSFTTMVAGTLITGVSMLFGAGSSAGWICVLAIVTFAFGEMMASPKSQEYVARIAPPGKEAMYMGYYFVAIALGNLFGGLLSGQTYQRFANLETGNGHPEIMWMIFAAIAVITAILLLVFNRYCAPDSMGGDRSA